MRYSLLMFTVLAATAAACERPAHHAIAASASDTKASAVSVPNNGVIPGTPAGDLDRWVKEIRKGIAQVPELMKTNPAAAQKSTMNLYITRQEYSEMYYGKDGRLRASDELAVAVSDAELRFHELMTLVGTKNPSPAAVETAVKALDKQQDRVAKLWKKTGVHIQHPAK